MYEFIAYEIDRCRQVDLTKASQDQDSSKIVSLIQSNSPAPVGSINSTCNSNRYNQPIIIDCWCISIAKYYW